MCDDVVQASPVNKKKRRRRRRLEKSPKKARGSNDSSHFDNTASTSKNISEMSTFNEEGFAGFDSERTFDTSLLYGSQLSDDETDVGAGGIFSYERLLEKGAAPPRRRIHSQGKIQATKTFIRACDLPELQEESCQINATNESQVNASVVSDTQVLRLCEAVDVIEELKRSNIELSSQWESPSRRAEPGPSGVSFMDTMAFDSQDSVGQEILRDCMSQAISEPSQRPEDLPPGPQVELETSRAPETYSRFKAKQEKDKQMARRLAYDYDSDSKSSLCSEQSVQVDDSVDCTPTDYGDLHKSLRYQENLQNLSSFFSESFSQEETIADGVYRHIMTLKAKKWEVRLLDWYKSARNFNLPDDNSSADFEGFANSEIESLQSESSNKSKDISSLLDDDDEFFKELRATCLANNVNQGITKIAGPSGETSNGVNHLEPVTGGVLDNAIVANELNNSEEKFVASTCSWNRDNNFATLNRDSNCIGKDVSSHLSKDVDVCPKSKDMLPESPRESQIWSDENLLYGLSTPLVDPNVTTKSIKEFDNPKTDENENNTKFIKSDLSSIGSNLKRESKLPSDRPCTSEEKPVISLDLKENKCKSVIDTQTTENFLEGASQWNANTSFTGCEAEFTNEINVLKTEEESLPEQKLADELNFKIPGGNTFSMGFQSARGKAIKISEEGISKAKSLWAEVEKAEAKNMSVDRHSTKSQSTSLSERCKENAFKKPGHEVKKSIPKELNLNEDDQDFVRNLDKNKGFIGFKSLSGKPISVSKEAKERASGILSDVDDLIRDEFEQDPIKGFEENIGFTGFKSVSGKPISVSKEATNKAGNLFAEVVNAFVQDGAKEDPLKSLEDNRILTGFKKVTGESLTASRTPALHGNLIRDEIDQNLIKDFEKSTGFTGFKSVSGKIVKNSKEAVNRASNLFAEVDALTREEITQDPLKDLAENKGFTGFESVSGKPILVSKTAQNRASNLLLEVDDFIKESMRDEQMKAESLPSTSFSTMETQSDYNISEEFKTTSNRFHPALESCSNYLKELNPEKSESKGTMTGFTTVSGKLLEISSKGKAIANKFLSELYSWNEQDLHANVKGEEIKVMKSSSKPTIAELTSENQRMYNRFNEKENVIQTASSSDVGIIRRQGLNLFSRGHSNKRPIDLCSENTPGRSNISTNLSDEKPAKRLKPNNYLPIPVKISTSRKDAASTSSNPQKIYDGSQKPSICEKFVTPVKTKSVFQHFDTPDLKEFFNSVETSTPQTNKRKNNFSLTQEISASTAALVEDELKSSAVGDDFHAIKWDDFEDSFNEKSQLDVKSEENKSKANELPEKVPEIIIKNREAYRLKCEQIIKDKKNHSSKICPGELFIKKAEKNRQKIRDLVGSQKPTFSTEEELINKGLLPEVARLNFLQASDFKFSEPLEGRTVIPIQENTFIIPDDYNKIGLNEIKRCFLAESGVFESLLPRTWIDHHFKMILLKLAMLEKAFPQYFGKQICTPENIIAQLKYRYDREIDRAERSCLKKILENDDSAAKRMVLLVLDIKENNGEMELEVTDWWYSVRASVDLAMMNLVKKGKVRIGTKLMIQGAKLINCDNGCDPLEMSPLVRLQIHTNSCRRAIWDLKLGFFKNPKPFYTSLDDIQENGGLIFNMKLHILRVYPTVYLTRKEGSSQGIHSQKVEERLRRTEEKIDFDNFEVIFSQVQNELQKEKAAKRKRVNCSRVVSDPEELYKLIDEGFDLEDIEIDLSPDELNSVIKYHQDVSSRRMDEVNCRVKEKLKEQSEKRSSTELIKIRVIDAKHPKSTAVLSIWRPKENLREILKEDTSIEVTNCTPSGVRYGDMQLNSIKSSEFRFVSKNLTRLEKQDLLRRVTTIKEITSSHFSPTFKEVDTFGFIVMITNVEKSKFQSVFLCDAEENLLCINFWNGVKQYAYDDVIQEGRFISACNLQTRTNTKTGIIPCLFATEISIFTENPKAEYMSNAFTIFKNSLNEIDLSTLSSNCVEKIENLKNGNVSGNSFTTPIRKSQSLFGRFPSSFNNTLEKNSPDSYSAGQSPNVPTPQNRLDRLKVYGQPPDLSPIAFKISPKLKSAFKIPRKLE